MKIYSKSTKLDNVCYEIRGPVMDKAKAMEQNGYKILKLNIGNPAPFDLNAPDEIIHDVIYNLSNAQGYVDSRGIFAGRKAIMQYYQTRNVNIGIDDIYIGNGVSELIMMSMQGLLDNGDEILLPAPDYPLWTAAVTLAGGRAVHYMCDEKNDWQIDLDDLRKKVTPKTKGIVIINPNNPTGAVYTEETLKGVIDIARENELIIFSDEIYDRILYDDTKHTSIASLADDIFIVTLSGLSKSHRIAGFRVGWMALCGRKDNVKGYIEGINMLANMRLCSNAPAQFAIQTALGGYQSINDLTCPGGRLEVQRNYIVERLNSIEGIECTMPKGSFYVFPKIDTELYHIDNDEKFALDFLCEKKVLIVQGTGFNYPTHDHFRIVYLPRIDDLKVAMDRLEEFLHDRRG
ncbi:MAG: pyridoxal phosphate-dependent aminotransferase [Clostridiales bacterium]|nr:pyridoxal phosphate-dependent aminotransferase [Clostridiales bacterium]